MLLAFDDILGIPVPILLLGGYLVWKHFSEEIEKAARPDPQHRSNTYAWTWKERQSGLKTAVRIVVEMRLGYVFEEGCDSQELYRIGSDNKVWADENDRLPKHEQWKRCPRTLNVIYLAEPTGTAIQVWVELAGLIVSNEAARDWFLSNAENEARQIGPLVDDYFAFLNDPSRWTCQSDTSDSRPKEEGTSGISEDPLMVSMRAARDELGVDGAASWDEVRKAYRRLCMQYHPDTVASKDYPSHIVRLMEEKFARITQAYEFLEDAIKPK